ncbi:hypothetical protein [Nocardia vermiculata]|uniref:Low molecular weight antigen MTB12-like C-terminal domain-containing protein n=1 Tax=Nocardia vermiculata TaxID=257274 RepID=A0A846XR40_9NOCA|nr:hypothetical protein [Nocardia vermiculata]NKY49077.1 hypothetical protein [Nocardia vermiculata]
MFDRSIAAKVFAACVLTAMVATGAACGSDDSDTSSKTASATSSGTAADPAAQQVTVNFERFFDGATPADQKIDLLEDGPAFAETINAQADSPMAKSATAKVTDISDLGREHANVTFDVLFNGQPALSGQQGAAVLIDGTWKVASETFCALLTLQGAAPPVCGTASATPAPGTPRPAQGEPSASPAPGQPSASPAPGEPGASPAPDTPEVNPAPQTPEVVPAP